MSLTAREMEEEIKMFDMEEKMNKIHNVDCLEFMREVPDDYFDLVLTDPPYGTTQNEWDTVIDLQVWWSEISRIVKPKAAIICFSAQPFTTDLINANRKNFRYSLVWDKVLPVGFLNVNRMPLRVHEDICVFYQELPYYKSIKTGGHDLKTMKRRNVTNCKNYGKYDGKGGYETTERHQTSIFTFSNSDRTKKDHPTQKPEGIIEHLLHAYAPEGAKIFDPCMGSGTTALACKSLGLDWCGCELEPDYVEIANKRLKAVQMSIFSLDGVE